MKTYKNAFENFIQTVDSLNVNFPKVIDSSAYGYFSFIKFYYFSMISSSETLLTNMKYTQIYVLHLPTYVHIYRYTKTYTNNS